MVKFALIFFLCVLTCLHSRSQDATGFRIGWGITVNATGLTDIYKEPNVRIAAEHRVSENQSVFVSVGAFYFGSGYIAGLGIKNYHPPKLFKRLGVESTLKETVYSSLEMLYRYHVYGDHEVSYPDTGARVESDRVWPMTKQTLSVDFIGGTIMSIGNSRHFYIDFYAGLGLRFKYIEGFTWTDHNKIEFYGGAYTLLPGFSMFPDFKAGLKVGYFAKRKLRKPN